MALEEFSFLGFFGSLGFFGFSGLLGVLGFLLFLGFTWLHWLPWLPSQPYKALEGSLTHSFGYAMRQGTIETLKCLGKISKSLM